MTQEGAPDTTPVFSIEKIYVKDISLELPNAPQIFLERDTPQVEVQLSNSSEPVDAGIFQVAVSVTVTAKVGDKTMFLVEVAQAGIFRLENIPASDMPYVLGVTCPGILFPYAREAVSDLVTRAGFPPVVLNPVNFEALFQQRLQEAQAQAAPASPVTQ
ncbi:MAG: protein-export chaperone SecB [Betaproteobacteria bacterium]|nr:protein-export chaperone SecB [Betaproteobacteria bacterium]